MIFFPLSYVSHAPEQPLCAGTIPGVGARVAGSHTRVFWEAHSQKYNEYNHKAARVTALSPVRWTPN